MNDRRKLLIALGASAITAPLACYSQQRGKVWRIGFLWENEQSYYVDRFEAFKAGMRSFGRAEGGDYVIAHRSAQGELARLPAEAAALLALRVDLIVSSGTPSAEAARKATRDIPILTTTAGNPVGSGLAASLSRPGGNVTGLTNLAADLHTRQLDLLRQLVPGLRRVGFLHDPDSSSDTLELKQFASACSKLGLRAMPAPVQREQEIGVAFQNLKRDKAEAIAMTSASTNAAWRNSIIEHAAKSRLPALYGDGIMTLSGGLISYSVNREDIYRRAAAYADKIFKGARPGDLPIEQPNTYEMVINMTAAKALGIKIPDLIRVRADKVIE